MKTTTIPSLTVDGPRIPFGDVRTVIDRLTAEQKQAIVDQTVHLINRGALYQLTSFDTRMEQACAASYEAVRRSLNQQRMVVEARFAAVRREERAAAAAAATADAGRWANVYEDGEVYYHDSKKAAIRSLRSGVAAVTCPWDELRMWVR